MWLAGRLPSPFFRKNLSLGGHPEILLDIRPLQKTRQLDGGFAEVLRRPDFFRLWLAQVISSVGDRFYQFALLYVVLETGRQGIGVGREGAQVLFFALLPTVVFAPWIGRWVDKYGRRRVLAFSEWGRAVVVGALLLVWALDGRKVWLLALVACGGLLTGIFIPARQAAVPALVEGGQLVRANALMTFVGIAGSVVGASAAVLVTTLGETASFILGALGFGISGVLISMIREPLAAETSPQPGGKAGLWRVARSTWLTLGALKLLWADSAVRLIACVLMLFHFVSALFVILFFEHAVGNVDFSPLQRALVLWSPDAAASVESWQFLGSILLVVASGIGLFLGLMMAGKLPWLSHQKLLPVLMFFALGLVCWSLSDQDAFAPVFLLCVATGWVGSLITIPSDSRWQHEVDPGHHGKLFAAKNALVSLAFLIGLAVNLDGRLLAWRGADRLLADLGYVCWAGGVVLLVSWRGRLLGRWGEP